MNKIDEVLKDLTALVHLHGEEEEIATYDALVSGYTAALAALAACAEQMAKAKQ